MDNINACFDVSLPIVTGTTGWDQYRDEMANKCMESNNTMFYASNFSIGVHLLNQISSYMTRVMKQFPDYSPVIKDVHHIHKLDSPSGTAITLKNIVQKNGADVTVESFREGEIVGIHELTWDSEVDVLALRHEAISRRGFALGAFQALLWLFDKHSDGKSGIYNMNDLISKIQ